MFDDDKKKRRSVHLKLSEEMTARLDALAGGGYARLNMNALMRDLLLGWLDEQEAKQEAGHE